MAIHSAYLKIGRANEHIADLANLIEETAPFTYVLQIDAITGQRTIGPKKNEVVVSRLGLLAGDAIHNLRAALDQVVWSIVSPHATTDQERHDIAFPFSKTEKGFDRTVADRVVSRAPAEVIAVFKHYRPYPGGHPDLYMLHDLDIIDKHRLLVPTGDYTQMEADQFRRQVPDFPRYINGLISFGMNRQGDGTWRGPRPSAIEVLEKNLSVPVEIVFDRREAGDTLPMVPTLYRLVDLTTEVVGALLEAGGATT